MMNRDFFFIYVRPFACFHTDYIIRNISFWFELVHLKVDTSRFLDSIDFIIMYRSI